MPALSLDCLTLTATSPMELIRSADHAGFDLVSLWTASSPPYPEMAVTMANLAECKSLLAQTGIGVHSIDAFEISSQASVEAFRPAIEIGAELGGKAVLAFHVTNPDISQVADALGLLVELAADCGMVVNVEPLAVGATRTVSDAQALIKAAGVNAGIVFDTYHFVRHAAASCDGAAELDTSLIRYVQVNDGPAFMPEKDIYAEVMQERLYPGDGQFPLAELLQRMPTDVPWGIEAPSLRRERAGISPYDRADEAMRAMKRQLSEIG